MSEDISAADAAPSVGLTSPAAVPPTPVVEAADGKKRWLVVAGGNIPAGDTRPVIVVEHRGPAKVTKAANEGEPDVVEAGETKLSGYPTKADYYLRISPEVEFKGDGPVVTVGQTVIQNGTWGFSGINGGLHVGPAHPAYAAANLAWQKGATDIEIVGLSAAEKEHLAPWFNAVPQHPKFPAPDVKIRLT